MSPADGDTREDGPRCPVAVSVAGWDPSGGAGLAADLRVFAAHRIHGAGVVTAVTVQDSRAVRAVWPLEPERVAAQLEAVLDDLGAHALKLGMLGAAAIAERVGALLARYRPAHVVCDPVLVSTSGTPLLGPGGIAALRERVLPHVRLVTPNVPEASALSGIAVESLESARAAAEALARLGPRAVLIKGGHLAFEPGCATDLLWVEGRVSLLRAPRIETRHTRGTGCVLSAAIAARLARGDSIESAVRGAKEELTRALARACLPGRARGRGSPRI